MLLEAPGFAADFVEHVEFLRVDANRRLDPMVRGQLGQFMTPPDVAAMLASRFEADHDEIHLLDPGAGVGSLTAAFVAEMCRRNRKPSSIEVTAFELHPPFIDYLRQVLDLCRRHCETNGIRFRGCVHEGDFISGAADSLLGADGLFDAPPLNFNAAILNPPYRKLHSQSSERAALSAVGIETGNLYTGFMALTSRLLDAGGELVAITPRSFCNGPYFKPFRLDFLKTMKLRQVHVFESRHDAFKGDDVLQENIVVHAVKGSEAPSRIRVTSNAGPGDEPVTVLEAAYKEISPDDADSFIYLLTDGIDRETAAWMAGFTVTLDDLGLEVSTGRVVDFRVSDKLRAEPEQGTLPLIYPCHFSRGFVEWPQSNSRKPNALVDDDATAKVVVPSGHYVLTKRFSAKEEPRRIVAAVFDPSRIDAERIGFENHVNYFHARGAAVPPALARGLAAYLNSTLVDMFFRQFNGHTQVNATDLRSLRFPARDRLEAMGARINGVFPSQFEIDDWIDVETRSMAKQSKLNPVKAKRRLIEAKAVLKALDLPRQQQGERSALTLLAVLDLKPATAWSDATNPLIGVTPMMSFFAEHYGKAYAPNTRETVRQQTVHQFEVAGLIVRNPDDPSRPTNSGQTVYQIEPAALELLRQYGSETWGASLQEYLTNSQTLRQQYAQQRKMSRIPVTLPGGSKLTLSAGGQNVLVKEIIEQFCPRFAPGGRVLVCGDTDDKWRVCDREAVEALNVRFDVHGKFPDVVVHHRDKDWLLLIEAVTSHGPVDPKRRGELEALFDGCRCGLVFVTAFLTRKAMVKYLDQISWESEVWVAEAPDHMIHFDGSRFLGPYG